MTVKELQELLSKCDPDLPVYISVKVSEDEKIYPAGADPQTVNQANGVVVIRGTNDQWPRLQKAWLALLGYTPL